MSARRLLIVFVPVCVIVAGLLAVVGAPAAIAPWFGQPVAAKGLVLSPQEALAKARAGEIVLVDVRRPKEWRKTGVATPAKAITMHQKFPTFLAELRASVGNDTTKPIAVICARGGRTNALQEPLKRAGFQTVFNVAEGMLGGTYGPGWIKSKLPTRNWRPDTPEPQSPQPLQPSPSQQ